MKRDISQKLISWKQSDIRKPLVLRGARQVGKSYALEQFGKAEFKHLIHLNFDLQPYLKGFFERDLVPDRIIKEIAAYASTPILPQETLIIFDEVQECPLALNSLKYFQEQKPEIAVVAAGSLLGVKLSSQHSFPVGKVDFLELRPLSFFEFLTAFGKENLRKLLQEKNDAEPISTPLHLQLMDLLKQYFVIGGMPEAVALYLKKQDYNLVREKQANILHGYTADFAKHAAPEDVMKIMKIWQSIPAQLAKENKKFIFSAINKSARAREYESALQWLSNAGLIYQSHRLDTIKLPLAGYSDDNAFKVFMLDIGLLGSLAQLPVDAILHGDQLFTEFKGALAENFVAQELMTLSFEKLYYWMSEQRAEVDFIINQGLDCYPLEVKSGKSISSKSLQFYRKHYQPEKAFRTSLLNFKQDDGLTNLPLYAIANITSECQST